ncbi:hypothetical protein L1987_30476 [Smallanthus sonchifolius]|uniref:Uncharacterized protein n=1 Tax=Smallanthus sonchifolius TaxID=185202 RepID=A0ACB9I4C8_9ASTR|nr:hypothetical protein L1987_30476 [Smallanthus sonchifolius]
MQLKVECRNLANLVVLGKEVSAALVVVDSQQQRLTFRRLVALCLASISDCPISHESQLSNPFLGLPLEVGRCESCGAAEVEKCEGV